MLFNLGIYRLIDRPSIIYEFSDILIYIILTNDLNFDITLSITVNDMFDHIPILCICRYGN